MNEKDLIANGYRKYEGDAIDVYFNIDMCEHAGKCVHGLSSVFNTEKKPWINLDNVNVQKLKEVIDICPSGALKYIVKEK